MSLVRWLAYLLTGRGLVFCVTCHEMRKPSEIVDVTNCRYCVDRSKKG